MVELRDITEENYKDCLALDVEESQRGFVAANLYSLAQAYVFRDVAKVFTIYADGTLVGFSLLSIDPGKDEYSICRLMIDKRYQRKGYGREALKLILGFLQSIGAKTAKLSFEPENTVAGRLYQSCGFVSTGEVENGEIVMQIVLGE